jgi:glutamate transport system ATP-binding protein
MTETHDSTPLVSLENVNKHFGAVHVLRNINLTVSPGEVAAGRPDDNHRPGHHPLRGPAAARRGERAREAALGGGKSTLCRTINRLETM